ncbi:hypothetical protein Neosp_012389 [[Neocosmospora] mangrovei]
MPEYDYRFRTISEYNYTHPTPIIWQAWHEAYFRRITGVLQAGREPVRLFETGCTTESWTVPNCTRTCSDAEHMFSSSENVWNCMALATVAMEVVPGNKTVDPASLKQMHDQFDLGGSLEAFDKLYVFNHVRQCFWQSCSDSKYGKCPSSLDNFRCNPISPDNIQNFSRAINNDYCRNANWGVDADIAGPGILIAYMVQIALVLIFTGSFWMTRRPWERLKMLKRQPFGAFGNALTPETRKERLDPKHANRVTLAIHSTVSELQEAQTAFGLTIGLDDSERVFKTTIVLAPAVHVLFAIILFEESVIEMREKPESKISRFCGGRFCWVLSLILFTANLLSLGMLILCLVEVVKTFKKIQQVNGGQYSWGFGQLVAMAVWIPVVAKFLTFLIGSFECPE